MKYISILALTLSLAACNVTMKTDEDSKTPFSIPDLAGSWKSNCALASGSNTWKIETLDFTQTAIVAKVSLFSDSACTHQVGSTIQTMSGTYTITGEDQFYVGGFDLTLVYQDSNGAQRTGYQLGEVDNGSLYLGSYIGLNPQSRPGMTDRQLAFERVATP